MSSSTVTEPEAFIPWSGSRREPSEYEVAILKGLQNKETYQGYGPDIIHLPRPPHGPGEVGRLEGFRQPDPRIAQVDRRRTKNRAARKARRINR